MASDIGNYVRAIGEALRGTNEAPGQQSHVVIHYVPERLGGPLYSAELVVQKQGRKFDEIVGRISHPQDEWQPTLGRALGKLATWLRQSREHEA